MTLTFDSVSAVIRRGLVPGLILLGWAALTTPSARAQSSMDSASSSGKAAAKTADTGTRIIGRVLDQANGEGLAFTNVMLYRVESREDTTGTAVGGAMTATDGSYRIPVTPGFYRLLVSYVGYQPRKVFGIGAHEGEVATIDVTLLPDAFKVQTIEVKSTVERATEAAILVKQKNAAAVSDGISSQQIKKTPDSNAADVMKRVTGASVVGGRYLYIRGLGERYSSTMVNGSTVGTPEPNKRVVPLDLFAAGLLDNVVVQKTYTPDQPGEFGGGTVNIQTRDFPGQRVAELSISGGINSESTGQDFLTYTGGGRDFLGFDDGTRALPDVIDKLAKRQKVTEGGIFGGGFSSDTLAMIGTAFRPEWGRQTKSAAPNYSVSGTFGNEVAFLGQPLGFLASLSLSNAYQTESGQENTYENSGYTAKSLYDVKTSEASALWGAVMNSSYRVSDFHTLSIRGMYNRSAEDEVRYAEGVSYDFDKRVQNTRLRYVERGLFTGSAGMNHYLSRFHGAKLDWRVGYSNAQRNEPDRREISYEENSVYLVDPDDREVILDTLQVFQLGRSNPKRLFGEMGEEERSYEANLVYPLSSTAGREAKFKTGFQLKNRDRDSRWRRFSFMRPSFNGKTPAERDSILALPADQLMEIDRIGGPANAAEDFVIREETTASDSYQAHQDVQAGYAMFDVAVTPRFRAVVGARIEAAKLENRTYDIFGVVPDSVATLDDTDVLPAVNLSYAVTEATNLRAAYSITVSRPELRELSVLSMEDPVTNTVEIGNVDLKRSRITNVDLRWESYPTPSELFAVSAFYKSFEDPIERSVLLSTQPVYKPINAESAELFGAELECRLGLVRLRESLQNWGLTGNLTLVDSEARLDEHTGVQKSNERPLEGQSPYVANAGLFYTSGNGRTSAAVLYNIFGKRLYRVGLLDYPDIYERPRGTLDLTFSHKLRLTRHVPNARFKVAAGNLTDSKSEFKQALITHSSSRGRSISIGISTGS